MKKITENEEIRNTVAEMFLVAASDNPTQVSSESLADLFASAD